MRRLRQLGHRRSEQGFTLVELLMVIGITGVILVPVMAWAVTALGRTANSDVDADTTTFIQLNRFLDADVGGSYTGGDTPASTVDCQPASGSSLVAGTLVLRLVSTPASPRVTTYSSIDTGRQDAAGRDITTLVRRTCAPNGAADVETVVAEQLVGDSTNPPVSVSCEGRTQKGVDDCGQVSIKVQGVYGQPVTLRAARRVDPTADPSLGRRPIAVMVCEPTCPATVFRADEVVLDGTLSSDPTPGGGITFYRWEFVPTAGGPSTVVQGDQSVAGTITHSFSELGEFRVVLTVGNDNGATATAEGMITVRNATPIAVATPNPVNTTRFAAVPFDASGSIDPDQGTGAGPTFQWDFGDGTTSTDQVPSPHQYTTIGSYTVTLTVTDRDGSSASVLIPVTVTNRPPVANMVTNPPSSPCSVTDPTAGQCIRVRDFPVVFHASAIDGSNPSTDIDGTISTGGYLWDVRRTAEGSPALFTRNSPTMDYTFNQNGKYRVTLEITDNDGAKSVTVVEVTVNKPPTAVIDPPGGCVLNTTPYTCSFDGSGSVDDDGTIVSYLWDFGDGTTSSDVAPTKTWPDTLDFGTFDVTLTVTDNDGTTTSATVPVKVNRPPTVVIKPDNPQIYRKLPFTFDGSQSSDADGSVAAYAWDFGDGGTATGPSPSHTYMSKGQFTVTLTVTDNDGGVSSTTKLVNVLNQPPVAGINTLNGPFVNDPAPFEFPIAAWPYSNDPDGSIVNYRFDFGDGTPPVSGAQDQVNHTFASYGTYTVTLTVTDNDGDTDSSQVVVKVNRPPTASFTTNPTNPVSNSIPFKVDFDASASVDPDLDEDSPGLTYTWDFGDGSPAVTGVTTSHTYNTRGQFTVALTVDDGQGGITVVTRTALVGINKLPIPVINKSPGGGVSNDPTATWTFDGLGSSDPDGTIISYAWQFGDGTTATGVSPSPKTFTTAGCQSNTPPSVCTVRLTVTDNLGLSNSATTQIKMNRAPTAAIGGPSLLHAGNGVPFKFDGSVSTDPDGSVITYFWDYGDGSPIDSTSGSKPSHTYSANNTYTVSLVVRDENGKDSTATTKQIEVGSSPPTAVIVPTPGVSGNPPRVLLTSPGPVTFDGSGSSDPDGTIVTYAWDFDDGATASGAGPVTHTFANGTWDVTLTVTDDTGLTGTATVRVRVNQPPVPTVTVTSGLPCPPSGPCTVVLSGSGSTDPDGTITGYKWFGSAGPPGVPLPGTQVGATFTYTFTAPGSYIVTLTVTDNDGTSRSVNQTVKLNRPPVAGFVTNPPGGVINSEPYSIAFNAVPPNSSDPDGTIVSYAWDFGDGQTGSGATPSHTYAAAGTYTVSLTVTDNLGVTATATKVVKANAAPVAVIGPSTLDPKLGLPFDFDGSGSSDPDGTIASYAWDFGDGGTSTSASPTHVYAANGPRTVTLTVTDDDGRTATTTRNLTVAPNVTPTASFTTDPANGRLDGAPNDMTFDASGSDDPDGTIASYAWDFGDGANGTGENPTHNYTAYGDHVVTLTVTDNNGATATATTTISVNHVPTAVIETSPNPPVLNDTPYEVAFFAIRSEDLDGSIVAYEWDFGDGSPTATGDTTNHTFPGYGTFTVRLTVTDDDGATGTTTVPVKVNRAPSATITYSPSDVRRQIPVTFDGSGSTDPDGTITLYQWDFGDGIGAGGPSPSHTYTSEGTFTVTLTVTDENGRSASTTTDVSVGNANPVAAIDSNPNPPTVDDGAGVQFSATNSVDPDGTIVGYDWDFGDGTTATGLAPTAHVFPGYGVYNVTLTVTDNQGLTGQVSVIAKVNRPPVAVIGPTDGLTRGIEFQFTSTGSHDPDGSIQSYYWDFGDGTNATGPSPKKTYSTATGLGPFTITLTVIDDDGRTVTAQRVVTLLNQLPTAQASAIRLKQGVPAGAPSGPAPLDIRFSAAGSGDPDGTIVQYRWDFGDGSPLDTISGATATHTYTGSPRSVTATVTVVDNNGGTATRQVTVTVTPNQAPVASFTVSPPGPYTPENSVTATVDASASADPDGYIVSYAWDFDTVGNFPGDTATGVTAVHGYSVGYYTVRLTVTDNSGATTSTTRTVAIPGHTLIPGPPWHNGGGSFSWNPVPGAYQYRLQSSGGGAFCSENSTTVSASSTSASLPGGGWFCGAQDVGLVVINYDGSEAYSTLISVDW